jgi:hypothetical protein
MRRTTSPLSLAFLLAAFLAGCATQPVVELDYRCVLPNNVSFDVTRDLAGLFSEEIVAKANLQLLSQTRQTGKTSGDVTYIVSLKSKVAENVFVNVLFNRPSRTIAVTILGDIRNPEANVIAQRAIKAFSTVFPGSNLVPSSGNQALFGR